MRISISFSDDIQEKRAYEFLSLLERKKASFLAQLVNCFLIGNGFSDTSTLTVEDIVRIKEMVSRHEIALPTVSNSANANLSTEKETVNEDLFDQMRNLF